MNIADKIHDLYSRFGRLSGITIECHKDLVAIGVSNSAASAEIFLQGAQIARFQRKSESPILFLSEQCVYKNGQALRGGVPICWPWFGALQKNNTLITSQYENLDTVPAMSHGFVRVMEWQLDNIEIVNHDVTVLEFSLDLNVDSNDLESPFYKKYWPFVTSLRYRVEVGKSLTASFVVSNQGAETFSYTSALHSYFAVDHIKNAIISGFSKTEYIDALDEWKQKHQFEDIAFNKEVDRIYKSAPHKIVLSDRNRFITLASQGSESTVVWNPWVDKSKQLSQFADDEYQSMACIEVANALDDCVTLAAGEEHRLMLTIS